jgi:hypothetical protein
MKPKNPIRLRRQSQPRGFALVISLSLMVLLTVLAVGLLTLSSLSLRAGGAGEARAEAQANARLALTLAIGELQTALGPDQAVSARASSLIADAAEPNLVGAWKSWRWEPGAVPPDYSQKASGFQGWLVSSADPQETIDPSMPGGQIADAVTLINPATVGAPSAAGANLPQLRAGKVPMQASPNRRGSLAWAVMDESQKAPAQLPEQEPQSDGQRLAQRTAPGRARPEAIVESLAPAVLGDPAKVVSLDSAVVAVGKEQGRQILSHQADVTTESVGLLTDVAKGGLKTDLTTVFESSSLSPNVNGQQTLYYTGNDGAPRWDYLRSHYQLNRRVSLTAAGTPMVRLAATDVATSTNGLRPQPSTERLLPVIAKMQIMFSVVSHYNHITDRVNFYNTHGNPRGNTNYGCPHLVYDPVVTLYNPYDVALDLEKLRIRVWDPPVLFGFKKNGAWLRNEFAAANGNGFQSMARFQIANENNPAARRYFTMLLRETAAGNRPGARIRLQPGEVKVFSPWVESNWTWGLETAGQYAVRCFFDWNAGNDFGNRDGRTGNTFGVETVPGWDQRAGLQTDHLSLANGRPQNTRYDFEIANNWGGGWLAIKNTDTFGVEVKPGRTVSSGNQPDFIVDVLAGTREDHLQDILRTYRFKFADPTAEISATPSNPIIRRNYRVGQILQKPDDRNPGGKAPFAILSMTAKTTRSQLDQSMPWLHNHPVVEGADQDSTKVGNALDSYDLRFEEVSDFNANPGGIELDPGTNRGFYGATPYSAGGVSNVPMFRVPLLPASSLGDLVSANLVSTSKLPRVTHAFGNSRAHPLVPNGAVERSPLPGVAGRLLDHSYLINDALWDGTYFSTVATFNNSMVSGPNRRTLLQEFLAGERKLLNPRLIPLTHGRGAPEQAAETLDSLDEATFSKRIASAMAVQGPFNVNSDSVPAWTAVLSSLRDAELRGWTMADLAPSGKTAFPRAGLPIAGDADKPVPDTALDVAGKQLQWAGFRALDDDQIARLATAIVEQIRKRGSQDKAPSLTLAEFVNRRPGSPGSLHSLAGILQTAIDESGINAKFHAEYSKDLGSVSVANPAALTGLVNADARKGNTAEGAPPILTQGDLLSALAPVITVRGDTFRIRAYGESLAADGKVQAKAWCEAVVQRTPEYLDEADEPETKPADLDSDANKRFGRRFVITSFRWLSPEEV